MAWVIQFWLACVISLALCISAHAVPQIALGVHSQSLDLRSQWEFTLVDVPEQANTQTFAPQDVWQWPTQRFLTKQTSNRIALTARQRLVARMQLVVSDAGDDLYLVFNLPRLDAVHVFYRYDNEPWTKKSAGDTLPMVAWPHVSRQPTFVLPHGKGVVSVVVEMAHQGVVDAPVVLESDSVFHQNGVDAAITAGLLVGVNLVLAAVGFMAALNYRRAGFLSISLMTLLTAWFVFTNSGLAGVYMLRESAEFNDQSKLLANSLLRLAFPLVAAVVLSQRFYASAWWYIALVWAGLGTLLMIWLMQYGLRGWSLTVVPIILAGSLLITFAMLAHALVRGQAVVVAAAVGILLYAVSLVMHLAGYLGFMRNDMAVLAGSLTTAVAALVFLQVLVKQHRQGRMVMTRAKTSMNRDVLTGLLNRRGFEQVLAKNVSRMHAAKTYAAFFYVTVSDEQTLKENFGDEGFEGGMVQMAAAISSSVSVVDTVGRVAPNAFAVTVLMPRDAKLANGLAQKMLTRTISLANHGAPMAQTARIVMAWLPVFGTQLPDIEQRALRVLRKMEEGKRIAWIGGAYAQLDLSQMPDGASDPSTKPDNGQTADDVLPSLPGMINRIEREMLGPTTEQLQSESDRLMKLLKTRVQPADFANTKAEAKEFKSRK
jgi:GGDEF domain-containing protein